MRWQNNRAGTEMPLAPIAPRGIKGEARRADRWTVPRPSDLERECFSEGAYGLCWHKEVAISVASLVPGPATARLSVSG